MKLVRERVTELFVKHGDNPVALEHELQRLYGIVPEEFSALAIKMQSQEHFAELLSEKIAEKLNPKEEEQPPIGEVFYPEMTKHLAKNKEPRAWDENKTVAENLYPSMCKEGK